MPSGVEEAAYRRAGLLIVCTAPKHVLANDTRALFEIVAA
jgi:hypothetical protein